jgi:hypothetical protein
MYMYVKYEVPYDFLVGEMGNRIGIQGAGVRNTAGRRSSTMGLKYVSTQGGYKITGC